MRLVLVRCPFLVQCRMLLSDAKPMVGGGGRVAIAALVRRLWLEELLVWNAGGVSVATRPVTQVRYGYYLSTEALNSKQDEVHG